METGDENVIRQLTQSVRGVEDAMIGFKKDAEHDRQQVVQMFGTLTGEIKKVLGMVRDGGEGRRALIEEVQDLKRDISEFRQDRADFRASIKEQLHELEDKVDALERAFSTGTISLKVEKVRGMGLIISSLITAFLAVIASVLIAILK